MSDGDAGLRLGPVEMGPLTPTQVAYMLVANNDTAEIHLDDELAQAAGLPGAIVPGSFVLGQMGRILDDRFGLGRIESLDVRLRSALYLREPLSVGGVVLDVSAATSYDRIVGQKRGARTRDGRGAG